MPDFIIKVYITEYNNGVFEPGTTVTPFPESPTQMSDIHKFLNEIYDEFRRQGLYESSILLYMRNLREQGESRECGYDYLDDTADDHLFRNGPLPGGFTFNILKDDVRDGRARRGHTVFLTDVCEGTNVFNQWILFLEVV